jgi:hypothetical protein
MGPDPIGLRIEAETYSEMNGLEDKGTVVGGADDGEWLRYASVDLGSGYGTLLVRVAVDDAHAGQTVEFRLDSVDGPVIGSLTVASTGGWTAFTEQSIALTGASGVHDLFVTFLANGPDGQGVGDFDWFELLDPMVDPGTGGTTGAGGTVATGGSDPSTGGTVATGGSDPGTGGTVATTGGTVATGGTDPSTGGTVATGGSDPGTGGTVATTGGTLATGGSDPGTGGTVASTGGTVATGGTNTSTGGAVASTGGTVATGGADTSTGGAVVSTGGAVASGGIDAGNGGATAAGGPGTAATDTAEQNDASCGCRVPARSSSTPWGALLAAIALMAARRRGRR